MLELAPVAAAAEGTGGTGNPGVWKEEAWYPAAVAGLYGPMDRGVLGWLPEAPEFAE